MSVDVHTPSQDPDTAWPRGDVRGDLWFAGVALAVALVALWLIHTPWWLITAAGAGVIAAPVASALVRYLRRNEHGRPGWLRWRGSRGYVVPVDMPPAPRNFVGCGPEIAEMRAYLSAPSAGTGLGALGTAAGPRIISITGSAGIGKTALATRFAFLVADQFPDGQLFSFVNRPMDSSDGVYRTLGSFIKALQPPRRSVPTSLDGREARYAKLTRARKVIVVLDDVDGVDVPALRKLFPAGPESAVILTSHDPVPGVEALPVGLHALSEPDAVDLLESLVGDARVAGDPEAAQSIVRRASMFPLSLRLAGTSLAARPHLALGLAVDRMRQVPADEVQPQAGTLDLSFALLTDDERRAFCCLGLLDDRIFAPWTLAALLGAEEEKAAQVADSLSFVGLVQRTTNDGSGLVRFRIHEHVLAYARTMCDRLISPDEQSELRHALAAAQRERDGRDVAGLLSDRIPRLEAAGRLAEAANLARDLLDQARNPHNPQPDAEALALASLASLQVELGNTVAARELVVKAEKAAPDTVVLRAQRVEGKALRRLRQLDEARTVLTAALNATQSTDTAERIGLLRELSAAVALDKAPKEALPYALEAVRLCNAHPDFRYLLPSAMWAQGNALMRAQNNAEAAACLSEADDVAETIELQQTEKDGLLLWRAWIAELRAEVAAASRDRAVEDLAEGAMARFAQARHRYGSAYCQLVLGRFYKDDGERLDDAEALLTEALRTFQNGEDPWIEGETTRVLDIVRLRRGAGQQTSATGQDRPTAARRAVETER